MSGFLTEIWGENGVIFLVKEQLPAIPLLERVCEGC